MTSQHKRCTQRETQAGTQRAKRRRKRPLPYIYDNPRLMEQFYEILFEEDDRLTVYVYRASKDGYVIKPWLYKCHPFQELETYIRNHFGAGRYGIYIRREETMLIAGKICIG